MCSCFYRLKKSKYSPEIWSFKDYKKNQVFSNILYIFWQFSSKFGFFLPLSRFKSFLGVEMIPRLQNNVINVICIPKQPLNTSNQVFGASRKQKYDENWPSKDLIWRLISDLRTKIWDFCDQFVLVLIPLAQFYGLGTS